MILLVVVVGLLLSALFFSVVFVLKTKNYNLKRIFPKDEQCKAMAESYNNYAGAYRERVLEKF